MRFASQCRFLGKKRNFDAFSAYNIFRMGVWLSELRMRSRVAALLPALFAYACAAVFAGRMRFFPPPPYVSMARRDWIIPADSQRREIKAESACREIHFRRALPGAASGPADACGWLILILTCAFTKGKGAVQ